MSLRYLILATMLNLPSVSDVTRLPSRDTIKANLALAKEHVAWIESVIALGPEWKGERYYGWLADAKRLCRVWDVMDDIRCHPMSCETLRRGWLREIRSLVGYDAYYDSDWPHPWPLWRFTEIER